MNKTILWFSLIALGLAAAGCGKPGSKSLGEMDFGVITPEQKTQKMLTLQFNEDAQNDPEAYVQFLFVTKEGDEFPRDQIRFTVDGKDHSLKFFARDFRGDPKDVRIGIEFSETAKQQVYEGRFVVADASPDLRQYVTYGVNKEKTIVGDRTSGLNARFEYLIPWPVWLKALVYLVVVALFLLLVWFGILKKMFFLKFDGGVIEIVEPTQLQQEFKLAGLRYLYIGANKKTKQSSFSKLFTGGVRSLLHEIPIGVSIYPVKIKNKVWHKITNDPSTVMDPLENTLYDFAEYKLTGSDSQTIKFVYKNSKQQPQV